MTERNIKNSQYFINDSSLVKELVDLSSICEDDLVLEIGAGRGIITRELLKRAGSVIAVEKETKFTNILSTINPKDKFQLIIDDFIKWQLPKEKYKVFSNIPYNYTTDIINKLTADDSLATEIYLIIQKEAAKRLAGIPYDRNSKTAILLSITFTVKIIRKISPHFFTPKPKVDSMFVCLKKRSNPLLLDNEKQEFRDFVIYSFNQGKQTVLKSFKKVFTHKQLGIIKRTLKLKNIKPTELTIDNWLNLFRIYCEHVDEKRKRIVHGSEKSLIKQQSNISKWHRSRRY